LSVHHLQNAKLKMEALFLLVTEFVMCAQSDVKKAREVFLGELACDPAYAGALVLRDLQ
jgi:hypothetical protein